MINYFDKHIKELLQGSAIAFSLKIIAACLGMGLNLIITRKLGIEEAGIYFLSVTIITACVNLGRFGTEGTLVREISSASTTSNWILVNSTLRSAIVIVLFTSTMLALTLYFIAPILSKNLFSKPELTNILQLMSFSIVPFAIYMTFSSAFQGLKEIFKSNLILSIIMPVSMIFGSSLIFQIDGVEDFSIIFLISTIVTLICGYLYWKRWELKNKVINYTLMIKKISLTSIPLFKASIFGIIMSTTPMILLGIWGVSADLAGFQIAIRIAMLTTFVLTAVNSIFAPKISSHFTQGEDYLVRKLIWQSTFLMVLFTIPFLFICLFFPVEILQIFGSEFGEYSTVLIILVVAQFINVSSGSIGQVLVMTGNQQLLYKSFMYASIIAVTLSIILIQKYSAIGAAISSSMGIVLTNLLALYYSREYLLKNED